MIQFIEYIKMKYKKQNHVIFEFYLINFTIFLSPQFSISHPKKNSLLKSSANISELEDKKNLGEEKFKFEFFPF